MSIAESFFALVVDSCILACCADALALKCSRALSTSTSSCFTRLGPAAVLPSSDCSIPVFEFETSVGVLGAS